jgi:hypothetical protein
VFQVRDRGEDRKAVWTELGIGFENKDGSINLMLNAVPLTGKLQVRTYEVKEARK